jgi:Domain of unknown function (DUF5666)
MVSVVISRRRVGLGMAALLAAPVLSACGGGGGSSVAAAAVGSGANTLAIGPITGFGSVILNGIRYDDSSALIESEDDDGFSRSQLGLGMFATLEGEVHDDGLSGTARVIRLRSELQGPVTSVNLAASEFHVLGNRVLVDAVTVLQGLQSLAELTAGAVVEVHGTRVDATLVRASRIERRTVGQGTSVRGIVSALDASSRSFSLGNLVVDYSGATLSVLPVNGMTVKVRGVLQTSGNRLVATKVQGSDDYRALTQGSSTGSSRVELKGVVAAFAGMSSFQVVGVPVDGSKAVYKYGSAAGVANGAYIEVKGTLVNGVLVASQLELEDSGLSDQRIELKGTVTDFSSVSSFRVNGILVNAASARFEYGSGASLRNGVNMEVKGQYAGNVLTATKVELK